LDAEYKIVYDTGYIITNFNRLYCTLGHVQFNITQNDSSGPYEHRDWKEDKYLISDFNIKLYMVAGYGGGGQDWFPVWGDLTDTDNNTWRTFAIRNYPTDKIEEAENNRTVGGWVNNVPEPREGIFPYTITNDNYKHVRIFGYCKYTIINNSTNQPAPENWPDVSFLVMGSNDGTIDQSGYTSLYKIDKTQYGIIEYISTSTAGASTHYYKFHFNLLIKNAPKYIRFKNSSVKVFSHVNLYYSQFP
jgi:hypothetical protein